MKMMISQGRVVEGSPDEICEFLKMIDDRSINKEIEIKNRISCAMITRKEAKDNILKYAPGPIRIKDFLISLGFKFRIYGEGKISIPVSAVRRRY